MGDQHDFSPMSGLEGWNERYSIKEFEKFFNDCDYLLLKELECEWGWVLRKNPQKSSSSEPYGEAIRDELQRLLEKLIESTLSASSLVQFWVPKVVGGKRYLTTSDQPFAVGWHRHKGLCWYRKHCIDYSYFVGELGENEEDIGPPVRVFRNGHPESSPDLRLYSNADYPLRDYAARCGGNRYIALPLFDLLRNQCIGVLELLTSCEGVRGGGFHKLDETLKKTGFRSVHIGWPSMYKTQSPGYEQKSHESEFTEMLEMAIDAVPELHLAQVWIPCEQCAYTKGNNLSCIRRSAFKLAARNNGMRGFSDACGYHNVQSQKGIAGMILSSRNKLCFCQNLCDLSISEYPLAHYAQQARLSFYFAICLQSVHSSDCFCVVEFFFHPDHRKDAYPWSILHLLFQIMEKKLLGFKVASGEKLGEEAVELVGIRNNMRPSCELGFGQPNISPCIQQKKHRNPRELTTVSTMAGYDKSYAFSDFLEYLQKPDLCSSTPSKDNLRYLFWTMEREELPECKSNIRILLQENKERRFWQHGFEGLVQFWALKRVKNRFYLSTSDQPFAVTHLSQGLCWYRKQCADHEYFVNEEAKEEELGPPGRVFRKRYSESSPDLRLYTTKEFPLRDNAARCGLRHYLALPIFDLQEKQCVGVLEYVGFSDVSWKYELGRVKEALKATNLRSSHIKDEPCFKKSDKQLALNEIIEMLRVATETSQLYMVQVWVPCSKCDAIKNSMSCLECAVFQSTSYEGFDDFQACQFQKVQSGKGITGTVLACESKSCFYPNLCDFSLKEEPRAHHLQQARLDVCFAICLQSSYTGSNTYILEFFLDKGTRRCEHLCSFLYFLLSTMKEKLKSFKVASGKRLGDEMVVEVVTFGKNNDFTSSESSQPYMLPLKFEITQRPKMECPHWKNQVAEAEQSSITATDFDKGVTITTKSSKRRKDEINSDISCEDPEHCLGKKLKDVKNQLPFCTLTSKHACKEFGIERSPSSAINKSNPLLCDTSTENKHLQDCDISKSIQHVSKAPEVDYVIVKANFDDDIVKIQLSFFRNGKAHQRSCKEAKFEDWKL